MTFAVMQKGKPMLKVPYGQDPYSVIGKYIRDHITAIEDIIAVIEIDDITTNQLFMVDMNEENYFIWENDWWEGEEDVTLIDFFPVSEAQRANQNVQSADTIIRQNAIDEIRKCRFVVDAIEKIRSLQSAQSEQQWIPCSERLPEKCDWYLVSGKNKVWLCEFVQMMTVYGWSNDVSNPVVKAWMPLPEPYIERKDNEQIRGFGL